MPPVKHLNRRLVGLPTRDFLYTLDQIGTLVGIELASVRMQYTHFEGRSVGARPPDKLLARDISPADAPPDWRVSEQELIRWMKGKGFRVYDSAWVL